MEILHRVPRLIQGPKNTDQMLEGLRNLVLFQRTVLNQVLVLAGEAVGDEVDGLLIYIDLLDFVDPSVTDSCDAVQRCSQLVALNFV